MTMHNTLTVTVAPTVATGNLRDASRIEVKLGDLLVAYRNAGGRYTLSDAVADWKRNPWLYRRGVAWEGAEGLGLVRLTEGQKKLQERHLAA